MASGKAKVRLAHDSGFALLMARLETVWPILAFVILLDALPLGICLIVWATSARPEELHDRDNWRGVDRDAQPPAPPLPPSLPNGVAALRGPASPVLGGGHEFQ